MFVNLTLFWYQWGENCIKCVFLFRWETIKFWKFENIFENFLFEHEHTFSVKHSAAHIFPTTPIVSDIDYSEHLLSINTLVTQKRVFAINLSQETVGYVLRDVTRVKVQINACLRNERFVTFLHQLNCIIWSKSVLSKSSQKTYSIFIELRSTCSQAGQAHTTWE